MSCLDPGDQVIIPEPFYANYNGFAQMAGEVMPVTAHIDEGFALPLRTSRQNQRQTKAILLCNPGNPTGTVYAPGALDALARLVKDHDLYLFAARCTEFCYDGATPKSVMQLPGLEDNVVLVDSVSKRYSMWRAHWRDGHQNAVPKGCDEVRHGAIVASYVGAGGVEAALDTSAEYFERFEHLRGATKRLVEGLRAIPGVLVLTGGAFYAVRTAHRQRDAFCQWM